MSHREKCRSGRNVAGRKVAGRNVAGRNVSQGEMSYNHLYFHVFAVLCNFDVNVILLESTKDNFFISMCGGVFINYVKVRAMIHKRITKQIKSNNRK